MSIFLQHLGNRKPQYGYVSGPSSLKGQSGFTLVELMVSIVLGLVLIAGVLNVFVTNRESFRTNENIARMQEDARIAFDFMARDLREAGTNPCGTPLVANVIRASSAIPWWADWNLGTIQGYDAGQDMTAMVAIGTGNADRAAGTDAVLVIRAAQDGKIVSAHDTSTHDITVDSVTDLDPKDVLIACDMNSAAIFQIETVSPSTKNINHAQDAGNYNCSGDLGYPTPSDCPTTPPAVKQFTSGGVVVKLLSTFWYVGVNSAGKKSLYRTKIIRKSVGGAMIATTEREEILDGVSDMQIEYLTKNKTANTLATSWIPANDPTVPANPNPIFSTANGGWTKDNVEQAVAARITLTLQSDEKVGENHVTIERKLIHVVGFRSRDLLY
ncbi:PilW family protein [Rhodoferax sp. AJA081-3]|uniref:PilW family protein n=1 Tax=Rhodoferax sp. AJA081-3 TaxID=2752316 RepID=UPI001ADF5C51|nr:PilW family protein [Rhodoferax sp. AJA081-3]